MKTLINVLHTPFSRVIILYTTILYSATTPPPSPVNLREHTRADERTNEYSGKNVLLAFGRQNYFEKKVIKLCGTARTIKIIVRVLLGKTYTCENDRSDTSRAMLYGLFAAAQSFRIFAITSGVKYRFVRARRPACALKYLKKKTCTARREIGKKPLMHYQNELINF